MERFIFASGNLKAFCPKDEELFQKALEVFEKTLNTKNGSEKN